MTTTAQCLCGAVRISAAAEPVAQFYCHCDDCKAISGGAYIGVSLYPAEAVTVEKGELDSWTLRTMERRRCAVCGVHMMGLPSPELTGIKGDRLAPSSFKPQFHINCQRAVAPVVDSLPHYADLPEAFGGSGKMVDW